MGSAKANLICIPPGKVPEVWPAVDAMIERGYAAADEFIPETLMDDFANLKALLWVAVDGGGLPIAAMVTRLLKRRSGLICQMAACGGSGLSLWEKTHDQIEQYAKDEGCAKVIVEGREGWARVLAPTYKPVRIVLEKELTEHG